MEYNQKEKLGQSNEKKKKERNTFFCKKRFGYLPSEVASCSEMFEIIGKPSVYFA